MRSQWAFIFLIATFAGCEKKRDQSNPIADMNPVSQVETGPVENYRFRNERLVQYEQHVGGLPSDDIFSITTARQTFDTMFMREDQPTRDSAYYIFEYFYTKVEYAVADAHANDTTGLDSLVFAQGPVSKRLQEFERMLHENGFQIDITEGFSYIKKDRKYVRKHFYKYLSPLMIKFLDQLEKENEEGYMDDGGLSIEPRTLVDRVIFWENFIEQNPDCLFKILPQELKESYTATLITGADNTPLYLSDDHPLNDYYRDAYDYLFQYYPESSTSKRLRSYYASLLTRDTTAIRKFRERYF
jgi:hypothetical protein